MFSMDTTPEISEAYRLMHENRPHDAIAAFRAALLVHGNDADLWHDLGYQFELCGRTDEAADAYQRSINLRPDRICSYNNQAIVLQDTGRISEAALIYQVAFDLEPNDADLRFNYARFVQETGDRTGAIREYKG